MPSISNQQQWEELSKTIIFNGGAQVLIKNTMFDNINKSTLTLTLDEQFANLLSNHVQKSILTTLRKSFANLNLIIKIGKPKTQTLAQKEARIQNERTAKIQKQFLGDKIVQKLEQTFNTKVDIKSIKEVENV